MLYVLISHLKDWLQAHDLFGYVRVFTYIEFRAVSAILLSFLIVMLLGKRTIRWLVRMKIGDHPEFYNAQLNELMRDKSRTPTMGGILICGAILTAVLLLANLSNFYIKMAIICLVWLAVLGGFDDWLKLTSARRGAKSRDGLLFWEKLVLQLGLAVVLCLFIHHHGMTKFDPGQVDNDPARQRMLEQLLKMSHALNVPFLKTWEWQAGQWVPAASLIDMTHGWLLVVFIMLGTLVITGTSNAVNLTDGMDGLASGIMCIVAFAFMILALLSGRDDGDLAKFLLIPYIPLGDELAVVAGAMVGACMGFLWFNCHPAQVFMGDTGSLTLGGLIGFIAVVIRQELLLIIIGGVFMAEMLSVVMQVSYFKFSGGRRIFKCAPIHHHFHLSGWTEQQVVVRFWLISAILAAFALATIKLR